MRVTVSAPATASAIVMSLLVSCSTIPVPVDPAAQQQQWRAHQHEVRQVAGWQLSGRIAVRTPDDGWNAAVEWRQPDGDRYSIEFSGPFGQGVASLQARPGTVTLALPERPLMVASDAQSLLAAELGWDIPVDALRFWMLGLPAPGMPFAPVFDTRGRLAELQQADWGITYQRYGTVEGVALPGKIMASNGDVRLRVVVDRWAIITAPNHDRL